uniref:Uncharacterized protein n=1 Tax=Trypanosoma congolense (strain IL3000) TaxID=1068625 RepID=G0UJH0_TRYCI|nr:conserved hypothetical protein [Trypanosoma congolense IL3000]
MFAAADVPRLQGMDAQRTQVQFPNTAALRKAVMLREDEYGKFEQQIVVEVNELRRDPAAYAHIIEEEAALGFPYVRSDSKTQCCSEMTLAQLRVYIQDFKQEHAELENTIVALKKEWEEEQLGLKERWNQEDAERARKSRRLNSRRMKGFSTNEDNYIAQRERTARRMNELYKRQIREAEERRRYVEHSCKWATEGANIIISCVQRLLLAEPMPVLQNCRSLTLAARDVSNEYSGMSEAVPESGGGCSVAANKTTGRGRGGNESTDRRAASKMGSGIIESDVSDRVSYISESLPDSSDGESSGALKEGGMSNVEQESTPFESKQSRDNEVSHFNVSSDIAQISVPQMALSLTAIADECEMLKQKTMQTYEKYGCLSGALRGIHTCDTLAPRRVVLQMLLAPCLPQFLLLAANAQAELYEYSRDSICNPLLWYQARLIGCGWVRRPNGRVSLTLLLATNFEELSIIHERQDFSLPQIHRIINSKTNKEFRKEDSLKPSRQQGSTNRFVMVSLHSTLLVEVVQPTLHPVFVDRNQHIVRVVLRVPSSEVEICATATASTDPIPTTPLLDNELIFIQRRLDDMNEIEILLDVRVARLRWSCQPLLIHIFERRRGPFESEPFANIGAVRVMPTMQCSFGRSKADDESTALKRYRKCHHFHQPPPQHLTDVSVICVPPVLEHQRCTCPIYPKEEPHGWPLIMDEFQQRCATLIEPLSGVWTTVNRRQRVAIRIPWSNYQLCLMDMIGDHLRKEECYIQEEQKNSTEDRLNEFILQAKESLSQAEEEEKGVEILQQDVAVLQKSMLRRRGKELASLKRQEDSLLQRINELKTNVLERREAVRSAEEELVLACRENAAHCRRWKMLRQEYDRLRDLVDIINPPCVEVILVSDDFSGHPSVERTKLNVVDSAYTLFEGNVVVPDGFRGRAVLTVNGHELVRWNVRPGN